MARRARVELPASDAPNVLGACLSIVCGLAIGIGAVAWLPTANRDATARDPGRASSHASAPKPRPRAGAPKPRPRASAPTPVSVAEPAPAPLPEPRPSAPAAPSTAQTAAVPPAPTAPEPAPVSDRQGKLELVTGRVAYVRCDGVAKQEGRFPCPRDRALEKGVWEALRGLTHCALLGPGRADVRLEFGRAGPPAVHVLSPASGGLDRDLVTKCTGTALSHTSTQLKADRLLVAFEISLRERP